MASSNPPQHDHKTDRTWTRDGFLISTDPTLISIKALTDAFASPSLYWAQALPEPAMRSMIANSLCFGLYTPTPVPHSDSASPKLQPATISPAANLPPAAPASDEPTQIGFARCITDQVTFLYVTDVYVLEEWRGQGLGSWLIRCVQEVVDSMPHLRRTVLLTSNDEGMGLYERRMRMTRIGQGTRRRASIAERLGYGSPERESGVKKELVVMSARGPGAMI